MPHRLSFSSAEWAGFLLPANKLKSEELPKESLDHGSKGTFLPEFIEMRVVNAQVGMKNLPLCEELRFLF